MAWEVAHAETFPLDLGRSPKKIRNAWTKTVLPILRDKPDVSAPPKVKKLQGYRELWRLRVSDEYRLVYRVELDSKLVTVLMLDHRSKVYERLGMDENGTPGSRIVADAQHLLEKEPTAAEVGLAEMQKGSRDDDQSPEPDKPLEKPLDRATLTEWGVPEKYHPRLLAVRSEGQLLSLCSEIPESVLETVLNGLWPATIEDTFQQPTRVASDPAELLEVAEKGRDLESFLLRLDPEQKAFLGRFEEPTPVGPWLLKGGPGSGKSTVALYCMVALAARAQSQLPLGQRPTKILFTTFTHSLVNAAAHLTRSLGIEPGRIVEVSNVDKLAYTDLPSEWKRRTVLNERESRARATEALAACLLDTRGFSFTRSDIEFLMDEIDWVLVGQDLDNVDQYVAAERSGRGRAMNESQRRSIWLFWTELKRILGKENECLFSQRLQAAAHHTKARYDFVFIDEAQDLKPVAIRYLARLCTNGKNVFLTADSNQSIYGSGMSWSSVAKDLNFQGRARILKRNYRTTHEIWRALSQLAPVEGNADKETLDVETVYSGPYPSLVLHSDGADRTRRLNEYLHQSLREERLPVSCAAVLCATNKEAEEVARALDPMFNALAMSSRKADLSHPGVKVLTMHTAKGLQFPVVAVVGVEAGRLPSRVPEGMDEAEHLMRQRRLLFVACSRAMRRLAVFAARNRPSPFLDEADDEFWEVEPA